MLDLQANAPQTWTPSPSLLDFDACATTPDMAAKSPENWKHISDAAQRKKVQNRNAQRTYRHKLKKRIQELERINSSLSRAHGSNKPCEDDCHSVDAVSPHSIISRSSQSPHPSPARPAAALPAHSAPAAAASITPDDELALLATWPPTGSCANPEAAAPVVPSATRTPKDALLLLPAAHSTFADGRTCLHLAIEHDRPSVVRVLLAQGADVHASDWWGTTALHLACATNNEPSSSSSPSSPSPDTFIPSLLLDAGARVDVVDGAGWSPLHIAAAHGNGDVARRLLDAGADMGLRAANGWTPLHVAGCAGHDAVVTLLLELGAEVDCKIQV